LSKLGKPDFRISSWQFRIMYSYMHELFKLNDFWSKYFSIISSSNLKIRSNDFKYLSILKVFKSFYEHFSKNYCVFYINLCSNSCLYRECYSGSPRDPILLLDVLCRQLASILMRVRTRNMPWEISSDLYSSWFSIICVRLLWIWCRASSIALVISLRPFSWLVSRS